MWIFLSDSFLSIVSEGEPSFLLVRARARGDIERVFPSTSVAVNETPLADYRFRASVPTLEVAQVIARQVAGISYSNFKDSVKSDDRHDTYLAVWTEMMAFQRSRLAFEPRETTPKRKAAKRRGR